MSEPQSPSDPFRDAAERAALRIASFSIVSVPGYTKAIADAFAPLRAALAAAEDRARAAEAERDVLREQLRWRDVKTEPLPSTPTLLESVWRDVRGNERREIATSMWLSIFRKEATHWRPALPAPAPAAATEEKP